MTKEWTPRLTIFNNQENNKDFSMHSSEIILPECLSDDQNVRRCGRRQSQPSLREIEIVIEDLSYYFGDARESKHFLLEAAQSESNFGKWSPQIWPVSREVFAKTKDPRIKGNYKPE